MTEAFGQSGMRCGMRRGPEEEVGDEEDQKHRNSHHLTQARVRAAVPDGIE